MERDPFVLTGLMWAWLEQLKEPVLSLQEAKTLNPDNSDGRTVIDTLEKVNLLFRHMGKSENKMN